ncbi:PREDICTED: NACHT, LRR and PYD domains-containing protein 12-like [Cyprinodon variegatus]|uniref:NACHT, LRR and PYD domains-containing protein 12-like n=1 Tax=Cyprinodon variegatus TaxID=28743 RepID=UPI000742A9DB|nr:PREDICTED: NACHT, LRR and PYD domains-containing protein 12-like [Cyprinodon variegatus]
MREGIEEADRAQQAPRHPGTPEAAAAGVDSRAHTGPDLKQHHPQNPSLRTPPGPAPEGNTPQGSQTPGPIPDPPSNLDFIFLQRKSESEMFQNCFFNLKFLTGAYRSRLIEEQKMEYIDVKEDGAERSSVRIDRSKGHPLDFSKGPGPSATRCNKPLQPVLSEPPSCPQCGRTCKTRDGPMSVHQCSCTAADVGLMEILEEHKSSLKRRCENVTEGSNETGSQTLLNRIYTELYIIEAQSETLNTHHEVRWMERASKIQNLHDTPIRCHDTPIRCHDIFKAFPDQHGPIRVVLTNGVAGVGKTFSVQKFTLDWAEGLENQDVSVVVLLSFRELNLIRDQQHSLLTLLHVFHPTLHKLPAEKLAVWKLLFIFDGLDESRLSLDFNNSLIVSDITQKTSVNILLMNLIKGNLLPSALVWITSRPAAASQIPFSCVARVTEIRGFTDTQKEEYFRRRFRDEEEKASRIIFHIKTCRSLNVICVIPVFCWITATVLDDLLTTEQRGELPKTVTDMYSHFLLVQTRRKKNKYHEGHGRSMQELMEADKKVLLKLGRLALEQLMVKNIMFYQEDLEEVGLDVREASVFSGICTAIFKRENVIFQKQVYSFVHLSIQEFMAAVYMFHCFTSRNTEVLGSFLREDCSKKSLEDLLMTALRQSLIYGNNHLELFVRFLHGLSVESNQRLLGGLLGQMENNPESIKNIIKNLKEMEVPVDSCPDAAINIFLCLIEMKDLSVYGEIQKFLKSENRSEQKLSEIQCTALAYMLQMSEEVLDELDLEKYNTTDNGRYRLLPAIVNCRKARFVNFQFENIDQVFVCYLNTNPPHLTELDLSSINFKDDRVKGLCDYLKKPLCKLQILRLRLCRLSSISCAYLGSALNFNPSHLIELDLSQNEELKDAGVKNLCDAIKNPLCKLQKLKLCSCRLSKISCGYLSSALKSNPSHLTELDLLGNNLNKADVKQLEDLVTRPDYKLDTLWWWWVTL